MRERREYITGGYFMSVKVWSMKELENEIYKRLTPEGREVVNQKAAVGKLSEKVLINVERVSVKSIAVYYYNGIKGDGNRGNDNGSG